MARSRVDWSSSARPCRVLVDSRIEVHHARLEEKHAERSDSYHTLALVLAEGIRAWVGAVCCKRRVALDEETGAWMTSSEKIACAGLHNDVRLDHGAAALAGGAAYDVAFGPVERSEVLGDEEGAGAGEE